MSTSEQQPPYRPVEQRPYAPTGLCPAWFEPDAQRESDTHTCRREVGHGGPHLCPLCGLEWMRAKDGSDPSLSASSAPSVEET